MSVFISTVVRSGFIGPMRRLSVAYNLSCLVVPPRSVSLPCASNACVPPSAIIHRARGERSIVRLGSVTDILARRSRCPLFTQKQTFGGAIMMSALWRFFPDLQPRTLTFSTTAQRSAHQRCRAASQLGKLILELPRPAGAGWGGGPKTAARSIPHPPRKFASIAGLLQ
jgi:hypothetical protein